jgi:hypothetical protein
MQIMNRNAEVPENWVQWAHWIFSPSSLHIIRTCAKNCTMKVEFSYKNYTLLSRYLRLKVHIVNPDSNLVVLKRAYEYWQPIWACNDDAMVQKNEININEVQPSLRFSWFQPEEALKGDSMAIRIHCGQLTPRRQNVFGFCRWLKVLYRSGKSKRDSNGVIGCRENWEILCSCWSVTRSEPPRKSSSPIRAAAHFWPKIFIRANRSQRFWIAIELEKSSIVNLSM